MNRGSSGVAGGEGEDDDPAPPPFDILAADDRIGRVVAPLDQDIGTDLTNELERRVLGENDHRIDDFERGDDVRSLVRPPDGPLLPLEAPDRRIVVDADEQRIAERARGHERVNVSAMKQVEHTVREYEGTGNAGPPRGGSVA